MENVSLPSPLRHSMMGELPIAKTGMATGCLAARPPKRRKHNKSLSDPTRASVVFPVCDGTAPHPFMCYVGETSPVPSQASAHRWRLHIGLLYTVNHPWQVCNSSTFASLT
jgi:hypothetical protein